MGATCLPLPKQAHSQASRTKIVRCCSLWSVASGLPRVGTCFERDMCFFVMHFLTFPCDAMPCNTHVPVAWVQTSRAFMLTHPPHSRCNAFALAHVAAGRKRSTPLHNTRCVAPHCIRYYRNALDQFHIQFHKRGLHAYLYQSKHIPKHLVPKWCAAARCGL